MDDETKGCGTAKKLYNQQVTWLVAIEVRSASFGLVLYAQYIFQILLIPEGYRLQLSIPCAYFVYTVWHCTGQHCSSMYVCMYHLFAGMWRPLEVLLQHCIMLQLFFIIECGIARFLCVMRVFKVRASSSSPRYLCAKFCFFRGLHCSANPWRKITYSITHSITHPAYLMPWEPKLALRQTNNSKKDRQTDRWRCIWREEWASHTHRQDTQIQRQKKNIRHKPSHGWRGVHATTNKLNKILH